MQEELTENGQHTQSLHRFRSDEMPALKGEGEHGLSHEIKNPFTIDT